MAMARYEVFSMTALLFTAHIYKGRTGDFEKLGPYAAILLATLCSQLLVLRSAAVQYVGYVIHIRNQSCLRAVNSRYSQGCFKSGQFCIAHSARSNHPAQTVFGHFEGGFPCKDAAHRR